MTVTPRTGPELLAGYLADAAAEDPRLPLSLVLDALDLHDERYAAPEVRAHFLAALHAAAVRWLARGDDDPYDMQAAAIPPARPEPCPRPACALEAHHDVPHRRSDGLALCPASWTGRRDGGSRLVTRVCVRSAGDHTIGFHEWGDYA